MDNIQIIIMTLAIEDYSKSVRLQYWLRIQSDASVSELLKYLALTDEELAKIRTE